MPHTCTHTYTQAKIALPHGALSSFVIIKICGGCLARLDSTRLGSVADFSANLCVSFDNKFYIYVEEIPNIKRL